MLDAHAEAGYAVGTPFASPGAYDFASHGPLTRCRLGSSRAACKHASRKACTRPVQQWAGAASAALERSSSQLLCVYAVGLCGVLVTDSLQYDVTMASCMPRMQAGV